MTEKLFTGTLNKNQNKTNKIIQFFTAVKNGNFQMILLLLFFSPLKHRSRVHIIEPHHEKTNICRCENKDADQLRGNHEADQRLCFRYMDNKIPLLSKSEILSL